jgi:cell division protein FtsB
MAFQFHHTSNVTKMIIIVEFLVVSYLLYTLTKSVYQSYQIDQHIQSFKLENDLIAQENKQKEEDYSYYSSDAYIEKIAKQNLGLVNPGEEVIVIPNTSDTGQNGIVGSVSTGDTTSDISIKYLTNPQKWWKFFFDISAQKK